MSDEYRPRMVKLRCPEPGVWKVNQRRWTGPRVTPVSDMLIEKYMRQRRKSVFQRLGGTREKGPRMGKVSRATTMARREQMGQGVE
jgi:hypothetical protein